MIRAVLVDDEPLAVKRLARMLEAHPAIEVVATFTDPVEALAAIDALAPELLFLDIQMPCLTGFELLGRLRAQPLVIFATAYDQYALQAFEVLSLDYLLKPVSEAALARAVAKAERMLTGKEARPVFDDLVAQVAAAMEARKTPHLERLASRTGERVVFLEAARVTHFYAQDKLTFASTPEKDYALDLTIAELEQRLDPRRFLRIHRSTLVNLTYVHELYPLLAGRYLLRLKDAKRTELTVARDRVKELKDRLGLT